MVKSKGDPYTEFFILCYNKRKGIGVAIPLVPADNSL